MVLKSYYQAPVYPQQYEVSSCSQEKQLETSLEVQSDDMTGKHRDEDHNPLQRPHVLKDEDKVIANGTSHADQGGDFVLQTEVGMNLKTSQVVASHFELAMFQQHRGTTAKSSDRGEDYPTQSYFGGGSKQQQHNKSPLERMLRSAGNSEGCRRPSKTSSLILGDKRKVCSFLPWNACRSRL